MPLQIGEQTFEAKELTPAQIEEWLKRQKTSLQAMKEAKKSGGDSPDLPGASDSAAMLFGDPFAFFLLAASFGCPEADLADVPISRLKAAMGEAQAATPDFFSAWTTQTNRVLEATASLLSSSAMPPVS